MLTDCPELKKDIEEYVLKKKNDKKNDKTI